eukprot:445375-Pyramimonas_sp.AAC.1
MHSNSGGPLFRLATLARIALQRAAWRAEADASFGLHLRPSPTKPKWSGTMQVTWGGEACGD